MRKQPPREKSRRPASRPRINFVKQCDHDDIQNSQRLSHCSGIFEDSGYSSGRGQFGFRHDITGKAN